MVFLSLLLGSLLLSVHASAKYNGLLQSSGDLDHILRQDTDLVASLTRRQDANPVDTAPRISTTPASGNTAAADLAKWEEQTKAACGTAIAGLNGASNPTGLAVCYNLPFLDNQTGVFQAELRLYNLSAPIDPWAGVSASAIDMALSYLGATVQSMEGTFAKRDISWPPIRARNEDGHLIQRQVSTGNPPQALKVLMYVGKVNDNLMGSAMSLATLRPLLIPQIELTAKTPSGQDVTATLSSQEASFVNGVFSQASSAQQIDGAAKASATAAAAKAVPFILPGTRLAFFPVGLVITSVWTAFFFLAVGLGTFGRMQFRDQYRRRMKREGAIGVRSI